MALPELPPQIYAALKKAGLESFGSWFQENFKAYMNTKFHTVADMTCITKGKGFVCYGDDGKQYRITVDASGNPKATLI